jgi:hypothetical protein
LGGPCGVIQRVKGSRFSGVVVSDGVLEVKVGVNQVGLKTVTYPRRARRPARAAIQ